MKPNLSAKETAAYRSMKYLYKHYIRRCRSKNIYWELTLDQFHKITSMACSYCGIKPYQWARNYRYNGIDRKDNTQGYVLSNSIPACGICNSLKSDRLNYDEMVIVAQAVPRFRQRRGK